MKSYKYFAITIASVIGLLFLHLMIGGMRHILNVGVVEDCRIVPSAFKTIKIDWAQKYPYDNTNNIKTTNECTSIFHFDLNENKYFLMSRLISTIGEWAMGHSWLYSKLSEIGFRISSTFSTPRVHGNYYQLDNGIWVSVRGKSEINAIGNNINSIVELKEYCDSFGCPFLFVQPPPRNSLNNAKLPFGILDFIDYNINLMVDLLEENRIDVLDLRPFFYEKHYSFFYRSDHHWNIEGAVLACGIIENEINSRYYFDLKNTSTCNDFFEKRTYKNALFGSIGVAVGNRLIENEDYSFYIPKEITNFHLVIPDKNIDTIGAFENIFIDYSVLNKLIVQGGGYAYETMLFGNRPLVQITNLNNANGRKVLLIKDSFTNAIAPYLALDCYQLDLIDVRKNNGNFDGSIRTYIEKTAPDIVIMINNNGALKL